MCYEQRGSALSWSIEKRIGRHLRQFHRDEAVGRRSFLQRTAGAAGLSLASGAVDAPTGTGQATASALLPLYYPSTRSAERDILPSARTFSPGSKRRAPWQESA